MSKFSERDKSLQREILDELFRRQLINSNLAAGVAQMQPVMEDPINPSLRLTAEEIKLMTGRDKLRKPILNEYEKALSTPSVHVSREGNALRITLMPTYRKENEFYSYAALQKKNAADLKKDPNLGIFDP